MNNYFNEYKNTKQGFDKFHNQVINMPRDSFSNIGYDFIKLISEYLLIFSEYSTSIGYYNYKDIYILLFERYKNQELHLNEKFENQYFAPYIEKQPNEAYQLIGRMFRHVMGIASFFGLINSFSKNQKSINEEKCKEFLLTPDELLDDLKRNTILSIQINQNSFLRELKGISDYSDTTYEPSYAILKYIDKINRPVTDFELSILLGRIDQCNDPNFIMERALWIGKSLPKERNLQIEQFFRHMGWVNNDNNIFSYISSQEPYFKFRVYLLYMEEFGLLIRTNDTYELSKYSKQMLNDEISPYLYDLDILLEKIDNFDHSNEIINIVLNSRTLKLDHLLETQDNLIYKLGLRSLEEKKAIKQYNNTAKHKRSTLIMFFAKHLGRHTCDVVTSFTPEGPIFNYNIPTFETANGRYYSEGHHILELASDDGPDIIENIILIDPNTHKLIHNGSNEIVSEFYKTLRNNSILTVDRFENMISRYDCLDKIHLDKLHSKNIIDRSEYVYLSTLLDS